MSELGPLADLGRSPTRVIFIDKGKIAEGAPYQTFSAGRKSSIDPLRPATPPVGVEEGGRIKTAIL